MWFSENMQRFLHIDEKIMKHILMFSTKNRKNIRFVCINIVFLKLKVETCFFKENQVKYICALSTTCHLV